jgi:broad specificity phosphatase PhoE
VISSEQSKLLPNAQAANVEVMTDPNLREEFLGPWEGLTRMEAEVLFPRGAERWRAGTIEAHDGLEGLIMVGKRAIHVVSSVVTHYASQAALHPLIMVTHANTAIALTALLLLLPFNDWLSVDTLAPGAWSSFQRNEAGLWEIF